VAYRDYNIDSRIKPLVLCVHAMSRNSLDFDYLARKVSGTGRYQVICIDVVGFGKSEWLKPESEENYWFALYAQDALQLLDHLQRKCFDYWIGSSLGGFIAMNICLQKPDAIAHLILNDTPALVGVEGLNRLATIDRHFEFNSLEEAKKSFKQGLAPFGKLTEKMWDQITGSSVHLDKTKNKYVVNFDPRVLPTNGTTEDLVLDDWWQAVKCPTLVIRGKESDCFPVRSLEFMRKFRDFDLIEFEGCGHCPSLMFEDQVDAVLKWMDKFNKSKL